MATETYIEKTRHHSMPAVSTFLQWGRQWTVKFIAKDTTTASSSRISTKPSQNQSCQVQRLANRPKRDYVRAASAKGTSLLQGQLGNLQSYSAFFYIINQSNHHHHRLLILQLCTVAIPLQVVCQCSPWRGNAALDD